MSYSVTRTSQSLVAPCEPTPCETLDLTAIDRVPGLRHLVRSIHVFKHGVEPAKIIRGALSKALVKYYPFAGRFLDPVSPDGEVQMACTGEGAWFVEAMANCSLEDVNYLDHPLMISHEDLLPDPRPEIDPLSLPLMMQVTEFTCGGFVLGLISVHTLADGLGAAQFMTAVAELARGQSQPTVEPVWSRHLIPSPPKLPLGPPPVFPSYKLQPTIDDIPLDHINRIKAQYFEQFGQRCSTFDISIAMAWQARTRAIKLDPDADVHLCFFANARHLLRSVLPPEGGFYGNCFFPVTVTASSGRVVTAELIEIIKLIKDAKTQLPAEFAKWAAGEYKHVPWDVSFTYDSLFVSDWTRLGFFELDYGWGTPLHIIPFAYYDFMAVAILGAPPAPKKGSRVMTQCVKKEHLAALKAEFMNWS